METPTSWRWDVTVNGTDRAGRDRRERFHGDPHEVALSLRKLATALTDARAVWSLIHPQGRHTREEHLAERGRMGDEQAAFALVVGRNAAAARGEAA